MEHKCNSLVINFDRVTADKMGCGYRHEEFPHIIISEEDRFAYLTLCNKENVIDDLINSSEHTIIENTSAYIDALVKEKIKNELNKKEWWNRAYKKYNLPPLSKYSPYKNIIYRHVTDNNELTEKD
jgi:hypothetical protein